MCREREGDSMCEDIHCGLDVISHTLDLGLLSVHTTTPRDAAAL